MKFKIWFTLLVGGVFEGDPIAMEEFFREAYKENYQPGRESLRSDS